MKAFPNAIPETGGPRRPNNGDAAVRRGSGPGGGNLTPASHPTLVPPPGTEGNERKESIFFAFDHDRFAGIELEAPGFQFGRSRLGDDDQRALPPALTVDGGIERNESAGGPCVDGAALPTLHLLRGHSSPGATPGPRHAGGLAPRAWRVVAEHIESNLASRILLNDLAALAGLSPSHFLRAFRRTSGQPPHRYIVGRRLSRAEHLIRTTDLPLGAVVTVTGFASNSHLTATMRQTWGHTPKDLRQDMRLREQKRSR